MRGADLARAAERRDLLDYMTPEERRSLLDSEQAAMMYAAALGLAGLPMARAFDDGDEVLDVLAEVLVAVHETDPDVLLEG